jgi:(R,R)-butanediol dehydrogenase / meso-butanediol dehydrogenase / diacetyl reductase
MKALVWTDIDKVEIRDVPPPELKENEAIIKVGCTSICGSDLTIVSGKHPRAHTPLILGHEFMGTIYSFHKEAPKGFSLGQRVVVEPLISCKVCKQCRSGNEHVCKNLKLIGVEIDGGFTEYVRVPIDKIYPINDSVTEEEGALIEPLSVAVHAVNYANLEKDDTVAIIGGGPIGLLIAQVVRAHGFSKIWIAEISPFRLKLAQDLGFKVIDTKEYELLDRILKFTDGEGVNVTFDAAGVPFSCGNVIPMTSIKGRIVMTAIHHEPCEIMFQQLSYREEVILGTRIYAKGDFQQAISLVKDKKVDLKKIITHVFSMENAVEAFRIAKNKEESCKVVVKQV